MPLFTLRRMDQTTKCVTHEVHFESLQVARIMDIVDTNEAKAGDCFALSSREYLELVEVFELDMPIVAEMGEITWIR
jgi:hypothetical protein